MSMKMKKGEKSAKPKITKDGSAGRKPAVKATIPAPGSSSPVLGGIGRSLGTLLDRTKAKIMSVGKAEA
jgi:hypothetical protein